MIGIAVKTSVFEIFKIRIGTFKFPGVGRHYWRLVTAVEISAAGSVLLIWNFALENRSEAALAAGGGRK
jgi:hypothetical protein